MDFGKAFTFVFEDEGWIRKLGFGGLIFFIGLLLLVIPGILYVLGYQVVVGRRVYNGDDQPMPEPDDFGAIIKEGLMFLIISFAYVIPILVVSVPFTIVGAIMSDSGGAEEVAGILIFAGSCLSILFGLAMAFFIPGVIAQYIRTGELGAAFRVGEIWTDIVQPNLVNLLLIILAVFAAQLIVQLVVGLSVITICGPIILAFPAGIWTSAFQGHLYGQLALMSGAPSKADQMGFA